MAQPKVDENEFLPTRFLDLSGKKYIFTVHSGNNKFRSNMITNQVTNVTPIPPTIGTKNPTPSLTKTVSPHPPATPAENYEKNRYDTQSSTTATTDTKDTRRQLFTEHLSKKPKISSSESSKGKDKAEK